MSAFFIVPDFIILVFIALVFVPNIVYADCGTGTKQYDEVATVLRVVDGDTVVLTDKRKVRFIGVNAPELAHYPKKAEPFALSAKRFVLSSLSSNKKVKLKHGVQKKDRYGRLLAHVFLNDGRNLNAMLLKKGLASAIVVPPNSRFSHCYFSLEQIARKELNLKNIWSHKFFQYKEAQKLDKLVKGFRFIKGKVKRIGSSRDSIWLQLAPKLTIRVRRKDFKYFPKLELENLTFEKIKNKTVYVRGWVYKWKNDLYIQLRHPGMINEGIFK